MTWPAAFAVTLLVEVPVYLAALTLVAGIRVRTAVGLSVAVNAVSHPLLWFLLVPGLGAPGATAVLVAEAIVLVGEAMALMVVLRRHLVVLVVTAVVANGLSLLIGVALQR